MVDIQIYVHHYYNFTADVLRHLLHDRGHHPGGGRADLDDCHRAHSAGRSGAELSCLLHMECIGRVLSEMRFAISDLFCKRLRANL